MTYPVFTVEDRLRYTALYQFRWFSGVHVCKITMQTTQKISIIREKNKAFIKSISNSAPRLSGYFFGFWFGLVFFPLPVSEEGHS